MASSSDGENVGGWVLFGIVVCLCVFAVFDGDETGVVALWVLVGFIALLALVAFAEIGDGAGALAALIIGALIVPVAVLWIPHEHSVVRQNEAIARAKSVAKAKLKASEQAATNAAEAAAGNPICVLIAQATTDARAAGTYAQNGETSKVQAEGEAIQETEQLLKTDMAQNVSFKPSTCSSLQVAEVEANSDKHSHSNDLISFGEDLAKFVVAAAAASG